MSDNNEEFYKKLAKIESGNDHTAKAKGSSARGAYQMTLGTFRNLQNSVPWLKYSTWDQHAKDPATQKAFAEALTGANENLLKTHGHEVNDLNRYLYHFAGAGGGNKLLGADEKSAVKDILSPSAIKANPFLKDMTVGDLKQHFSKKLGIPPKGALESPTALAGAQALSPWMLYGKRPSGQQFAKGGDVMPWEVYSGTSPTSPDNPSRSDEVKMSPSSRMPESPPKAPSKSIFDKMFNRGTPSWMVSKPNSGWDDANEPYSESGIVPEQAKREVVVGKNNWREGVKSALQKGVGVAQGATIDPAIAIAQMTGADDFANSANSEYEKFRKNMGGTGYDVSRLVGNIASPAGVKGAKLLDKGYKAWGKTPSLFRQGAMTGALTAGLNPVLPSEEEQQAIANGEDPSSFWGEKAKQVGTGALFGGALNKLIAPRAGAFSNPNQLPATGQQLANQSKNPVLSKVEQYRNMFPEADLTWGQALGPRANELEQRLTSVPFFGDIIKNAREKALHSQNVSMMNKALEPAGIKMGKGTRAGRDMFDEAYGHLNKAYDDILDNVSLHNPTQLREKIVGTGKLDPRTGDVDLGVIGNRYQTLSESAKQQFDNILENQFFKKFGLDPQGQHSVRMSGRQFKNHEEAMKDTIDSLMHGTGEERTMGKMLKDVLGTAYTSLEGKTPEVSNRLKELNKAYAGYKTLETASTASAQSGGVFNPLQTIKASTKGNRGQVARGKGLLQPEAELSQDVLGRVVPDSGTAGRLMSANPFTSLLGGMASLPFEVLASPKTVSALTQGGRRAGDAFGRTRIGGALGRNAESIVPRATAYKTSQVGKDREDEDDDNDHARGGRIDPKLAYFFDRRRDDDDDDDHHHARGGLACFADGGTVWSDIQGEEQALPDPREQAYGQQLEDTSFIGQASKLFRPKLQRYAEKMEKAGKTPEEIWNKTMTARLPKTGQWAQELVDTPDKFALNGIWSPEWKHLEKNVKAPDLFESYPQLRKQFGKVNPDMQALASHSYTPNIWDKASEQHMFEMNIPKMQQQGKDPNQSLLHEIQHYIQSQEGWPQGGGQREGAQMAIKAGKGTPVLSADDQAQLMRQIDIMKKAQSDVAGMKRHKGQAKTMRDIGSEVNRAEDFLNQYKNQMRVDPLVAHEYYKRLGGEAQSRLTERRMGLSGAERKQHYPFTERSEANPWGMDMKPEDIITEGYGPMFARGGLAYFKN